MIRALEGTADVFVGNISRAGWGYSFQNLLSDTFALLARCGVGCLFIGKNPLVFPSRTAYYRHYRESFFAMTEFIRKFQACGQLRTTEDPELTTALILEPLSRWAMDVRWRPLRPGTSRRSGPRRYVWTTCRPPTPGVDRSPVPPCFCETGRRTSPLWCRPPEGLPQALPETQQGPYLPENGAGYR